LLSKRDLALVGIVVGTQMIFDIMVPEVAMTVHLAGLVLGAMFGLLFRRPSRDSG
jgi:membrane associated rhomboid family serine protease